MHLERMTRGADRLERANSAPASKCENKFTKQLLSLVTNRHRGSNWKERSIGPSAGAIEKCRLAGEEKEEDVVSREPNQKIFDRQVRMQCASRFVLRPMRPDAGPPAKALPSAGGSPDRSVPSSSCPESFMSCVKSIRRPLRSMRGALRLGACAVMLAMLGTAGIAAAQSASTAAPVQKKIVEVVLVQSKVVQDAQGKEQLVAADSVKPGDVLEYRATYTNNTGKAVSGLVANLPIPDGLEYLPKSAKPGATLVKVAAKDGQFAVEPLSRTVNGKAEPVPYNEYRSLRWTLGQLPANGVTAVSARARVEEAAPPSSKTSAQPVAAAKTSSEVSSR